MSKNLEKSISKDWIQGQGLENICKWLKLGYTNKEIANNIGVSEATFCSWLKNYPNFAEKVREAKRIPELEIENTMFDLACGRVFVEEIKSVLDPKTGTIVKVEKVRKQIPPNAAMLIFMAKNKMQSRYRDYSPLSIDVEAEEVQQDVNIYIPCNGRDKNDS